MAAILGIAGIERAYNSVMLTCNINWLYCSQKSTMKHILAPKASEFHIFTRRRFLEFSMTVLLNCWFFYY